MAQSHTAGGGQFRTKAEYEAALRDKKKIEKICSVYNLKNPKAVLDLHQKLQTGTYPFQIRVRLPNWLRSTGAQRM